MAPISISQMTCGTPKGKLLSLEKDIYPNYDLILCISTFSATAPLTAKCKQYGFRGATLHGLNDIILNSGLAVDYHEVSGDAGAPSPRPDKSGLHRNRLRP